MRRSRGVYGLCPDVRFLRGVFLVFAWNLGSAANYTHTGMSYRSFQGIPNVLEVDCSGEGILDSSADVLTVSMYRPVNNKVIASANLKTNACTTSASFSLCIIDGKGHSTKVKTLILDLGHNETRLFGCNVTSTKNGVTKIIHWQKLVRADKITVSTISMLTSTTAFIPGGTDNIPTVSPSTQQPELYDIHPGLLITVLLFLIVFIIVAVILLIMQIKERRRRHYLAEEYDTPLPIKSEYAIPGGVPPGAREKERILAAGGRSPRPSTSSPIPHHVR
ncbi:uncharacterized protein, partial [Littorina saxatilis]|uniref:uncharacterized protein n=1 Tax=Littorina saxatilis TaxID=31220 RepID=UPI0038B6408A